MTSVVDGHRLLDVSRLQHSTVSVFGITEGSALVKKRPAVATAVTRAVQKWPKCAVEMVQCRDMNTLEELTENGDIEMGWAWLLVELGVELGSRRSMVVVVVAVVLVVVVIAILITTIIIIIHVLKFNNICVSETSACPTHVTLLSAPEDVAFCRRTPAALYA